MQTVSCNYGLSRIIAKKVARKNEDLNELYFNICKEQKQLQIIEEIPLPINPSNHKWTPYRLVIRNDSLVRNAKMLD